MGGKRSGAAIRRRTPRRHSSGPAARPELASFSGTRDLAWTYRQISEGGSDAFYRGEVARRLLNCSAKHGGTIAPADLAEYEAECVDPISTTYRGWDVYELPPNGQGIAALMMLNMLESFPLRDYGHNSVEALHALIETKKLAYADMIAARLGSAVCPSCRLPACSRRRTRETGRN